jgi:hypothetical protein
MIGHPVSKLCVCSCSCSWIEIAHILSFPVWMNIRRTRAAAQTFSIFCDRHDRQYDMTTVATAPFWAGQCRSWAPPSNGVVAMAWRVIISIASRSTVTLHTFGKGKAHGTIPIPIPCYWLLAEELRKHRFLALFASSIHIYPLYLLLVVRTATTSRI